MFFKFLLITTYTFKTKRYFKETIMAPKNSFCCEIFFFKPNAILHLHLSKKNTKI